MLRPELSFLNYVPPVKSLLLNVILESAVRGWPLLLVLIWLSAGALAYWAYRPWIRRRRPFRWVLWALRTAALGLMGTLLLGFYWNRTEKVRPSPLLVVGIDHSASITATRDSVFYADTFFPRLRRLLETHRGVWRIDTLLVGGRLRRGMPDSFTDAASNLSGFLLRLQQGYADRPLHGVVFITDGIANAGPPPTSVPFETLPPVATVRMGDTTPQWDTRIAGVEYNRRVRAGHPVPVRIFIEAPPRLDGQGRVQVRVDGRPVWTIRKPWAQLAAAPLDVQLSPLDSGLHQVTIVLDPVPQEKNTRNNVRHLLIKASEYRYRALLVMLGPHPDGGALARRIAALDGWSVDVLTAAAVRNKRLPDLDDYQVLILYEWPPRRSVGPPSLMNRIRNFRGGVWLVVGRRTHSTLPAQWWDVALRPASGRWVPAGTPDFRFPYFSTEGIPANAGAMLQQFFHVSADHLAPLLMGKDGPTVWAGMRKEQPFVVWNGQGWWQWDYLSGSHPMDALVPPLMAFLGHSRRARFSLVAPRDVYDARRPIQWRFELVNAVGQPDPRGEVSLTIRRQDSGRPEVWKAAWDGRYYRVETRPLPPGIYRIDAAARLGDQTFTTHHVFAVGANSLEYQDLQARHAWLRELSRTTAAPSFLPRQWTDIEAHIRQLAETPLPPVHVERKVPLMDVLALLAVILSLLFAEWFLRRWAGYY